MTPSKPAVTELRERMRRRAETYNTGSAVDPTAMGTRGYDSAHDAARDRDLLDALDLLEAENARARKDALEEAARLFETAKGYPTEESEMIRALAAGERT